MEILHKREPVDLPIGGVESHAAVLRLGRLPEDGHGYYWPGYVWDGIVEALDSSGGRLGSYGFKGDFTTNGDRIHIEDLSPDAMILESSSREVRSFVELPPIWAELDEKVREGVRRSGRGPLIVSHASMLPLVGKRHNFDAGGSHVCISAPPEESPCEEHARESAATALAALLPLIASGGLYSYGLCVSPMGAQHRSDEGNGLPYQVTVKQGCVLTDPPTGERRFHIIMDSPYSSMGSIGFGIAQLLLTMAHLGHDPAPGLLNNSLAVRLWARDPANRCRLAHRRALVDCLELAGEVVESLVQFSREYDLPPEYDALVELIANGVEWLLVGDRESLEAYFEYPKKRALYERLLRDYFDIHAIDEFNACAKAVALAGTPPDALMRMSLKEISEMVKAGGLVRLEALRAFMKERSWSSGNLRYAAAVMKKMERVELMLHERNHREFDAGWESFRSGFTAAAPAPTRALGRARFIRDAVTSRFDFREVEDVLGWVDWANMIAIPACQEGMIEIMVVSLADPGSPQASSILHLKMREGDLGYFMGVREFEQFLVPLSIARDIGEARRLREHWIIDEDEPDGREEQCPDQGGNPGESPDEHNPRLETPALFEAYKYV